MNKVTRKTAQQDYGLEGNTFSDQNYIKEMPVKWKINDLIAVLRDLEVACVSFVLIS